MQGTCPQAVGQQLLLELTDSLFSISWMAWNKYLHEPFKKIKKCISVITVKFDKIHDSWNG